jgi:lipopolysaccharide biosynthesis glycosyltransferase
MPLAVSLRSVLERWGLHKPLDVYVLEAGVSELDKAKVAASLPENAVSNLHWITVSPQDVGGLGVGLHFSSANYFRLLLPKLLPQLDRVLYLDADTVARADLSALFELFDDKHPLQACRDYCGTIANPLIHLPNFAAFGLSADTPYFNSGVLLMNLRLWREEMISEKIMALGRKSPETTFFADQTAINIILKDRIGVLDPEWNAQTIHPKVLDGTWEVPFVPQDLENARIVHYTSEFKPWNLGKNQPMARYFQCVLARTAWAAP